MPGDFVPPDATTAEKKWRAQHPQTLRWRLTSPFVTDWHFSLVAIVRTEIQAIDQHWLVNRVALSLDDGERDEDLAAKIGFVSAGDASASANPWPPCEPAHWSALLGRAVASEIKDGLARIRERQEKSLRRELVRGERLL